MERIALKRPLHTYQPRLTRFMALILRVKALKPGDAHLWRVMDGIAFQDTETALESVLKECRAYKAFEQANER